MKICEIDREVNEVITEYSAYGCETIMNAIARAARKDRWLTGSALHALLDGAIVRAEEERAEENMKGANNNEYIRSGLS